MERYVIDLSDEERLELEGILKKGKGGAHRIRHAQILLHSDVPIASSPLTMMVNDHWVDDNTPVFPGHL
jgi:hypothetical protein